MSAKLKKANKILADLEKAKDGFLEIGDSLPKTFPIRELDRETQIDVTRQIREARKVGNNGVSG